MPETVSQHFIRSLFHFIILVPHSVQFLVRTYSITAMTICQIVLPIFAKRTQKLVIADVVRTKQFFISFSRRHNQIISAQMPVGSFLHSTTAVLTARHMFVASTHDKISSMIPSYKIIKHCSENCIYHKICPSTRSKNCKNPSSTATCSNSGSGKS